LAELIGYQPTTSVMEDGRDVNTNQMVMFCHVLSWRAVTEQSYSKSGTQLARN
jgi:hypothetical protein